MKFKENNIATSVDVVKQCLPNVIINADALAKMQLLVENCDEEVGWLATAFKNGNDVYIEDVILFDQEVHATTCEITPEGLTAFGEELLLQENGMEMWNSIRVWGHSHVEMKTTPSPQDVSQMEVFADNGFEWFIGIIANKQGDLRVDLYCYDLGIAYKNLAWEEEITEKEIALEEQIAILFAELDNIHAERINNFVDTIKEEIKTKVRKKNLFTYQTPISTTHYYGTPIGNKEIFISDGKKNANVVNINTNTANKHEFNDVLLSANDVMQYLDENENVMLNIGECIDIVEVGQELIANGYTDKLSIRELNLIWSTCRSFYNQLFGLTEI